MSNNVTTKEKASINIAIRLDAGPSIGMGHLVRCMSLAEALQKNGSVSVCLICRFKLPWEPNCQVIYLDRDCQNNGADYQVPDIEDEIDLLKSILMQKQIDCLIVDHYGAGDTYFQQLRSSIPFLICIDDSMKRQIPVDLILNGNLYGTKAYYSSIPRQLLGGNYTLLRSEFQNLPEKKINNQLKHIYITSGGADPLEFCQTMVRAIRQFDSDIHIHVIVGPNFQKEYIKALSADPVLLHKNADMLECMLDADLFITGGGSTLYELAASGTPSISYILAENQIKVAETMWSRTCSFRGGWFSEFQPQGLITAIEKLKNPNLRQRISRAGRKAVSSAGAKHAAQKIMELLEREGRP